MKLPGDTTAAAIARQRATIYDSPLEALLYDVAVLEARLAQGLRGQQWAMPIRTRSKVAKSEVCRILGYRVPASFKKTQPRFPSQNLDVFVQKSNNLQIWNEEVDPDRRYALIRLDDNDVVTGVRVLTGEAIAELDTTGTLTTKYQAARRAMSSESRLVSPRDTPRFISELGPSRSIPPQALHNLSPVARPRRGMVLDVAALFDRLQLLVGREFDDPGIVNERGRGVVLQRLVCEALGLGAYADAGQFPDVLCQVLEVKLQLSPTIDLGLVTPDSTNAAQEAGHAIRHCDARYAVFYATRISGAGVRIDAVVVATGADFFTEFRRFEGKVQNAKLQIPLPAHVFEFERLPDEFV